MARYMHMSWCLTYVTPRIATHGSLGESIPITKAFEKRSVIDVTSYEIRTVASLRCVTRCGKPMVSPYFFLKLTSDDFFSHRPLKRCHLVTIPTLSLHVVCPVFFVNSATKY